ncbi:MAG: ATP-binding protein [Candidatus Kapaibacterium sp.]
MNNCVLSWSGGKDSSLAAFLGINRDELSIGRLVATIDDKTGKNKFQGVPQHLLEKQAELMNKPIDIIRLPENCPNKEYIKIMKDMYDNYREDGYQAVVYGDIYLEDIKKFRETKIHIDSIGSAYPLWGMSTQSLAELFIDAGFKAVITAIDTEQLSEDILGRQFDKQFLDDLPPSCDPCGENGEYHSFVYDGPIFTNQVKYTTGKKYSEMNRFKYIEIK